MLWFLFTELCSLLLRKSFAFLHNVNFLNLCSGLVRKVNKTLLEKATTAPNEPSSNAMSLSRTTRKSYYFHEPSKPNANQLTNMRVSKCQQDLYYILMNLTRRVVNNWAIIIRASSLEGFVAYIVWDKWLPPRLSCWFRAYLVSGLSEALAQPLVEYQEYRRVFVTEQLMTRHTQFSIQGHLSDFFLIMAVKTLKNPYRLETVTFKLS